MALVEAGNDGRGRLLEVTPLIADRSKPSAAYGNVDHEVIGNEKKSRVSGRSVILITTGLGRFAFYGIVCNLAAFLTENAHPVTVGVGMSSGAVVSMMLVVSDLPYLFSFLSGTLADTKWGRYKVYFGSLIMQCVGSLLLLLAVVMEQPKVREHAESTDEDRFLEFLVCAALIFLAFGMAGSGGTEIPLGVDQYRDEGPKSATQFFALYYIAVNLAGTVSYAVLSFVQINYKYVAGLAPTSAGYLIAVFVLWYQRDRLQKFPPKPRAGVLRIVFKIAKRVWRTKPAHGERLTWEERATRSPEGSNSGLSNEDVENVRRLGGVFLVLVSLTVYMVIKAQTNSQFVQQGELMKEPFDRTRGLIFPSTMFMAFNGVSILVSIPVLHGYVIPKMTTSDLHYNINNLRRIGFGMIIATASLLAALVVEIYRHRAPEYHIYDKFSGENLTVSDMWTFYQIPQYTLSGLAEVFVFISALEFAYFRSPRPMRGFSIGLVYSVMGLGGLFSFIMSITTAAIDNSLVYQTNTTTYGNVHYFYVFMIALMVFGLVMFTITARRFKDKSSRHIAIARNY